MVHRRATLAAILTLLSALPVVWAQDIAVVGLFADRAVIKVDGQTHLLKVGESIDDLTLLAVNSQEARLKVGKKELVLGLGQDRGGIQASASEKAEVIISPNAMNQFLTNGMINGRVVEFLVDTGANTVSMNRQDAKRLGIDYRRLGTPGYSSTANGTIRNWHVLLDKVKVGGIVVSSVDATIRDTDDPIPLLLGMSFLGRIKMEHQENRLRLSSK